MLGERARTHNARSHPSATRPEPGAHARVHARKDPATKNALRRAQIEKKRGRVYLPLTERRYTSKECEKGTPNDLSGQI